MHHGLPGMIGQPVRSHATWEVGSVLESVPFLREKRHVREKAHKPATATLTLAQVSIYYAVCDSGVAGPQIVRGRFFPNLYGYIVVLKIFLWHICTL